jgi:parvulin-like peptidyl-prolyl isomerase
MSNESGKKPVLHKKHIARLEREQRQTRLILYIFFGILAAVILLLIYGWLDVNVLQLNRPVATIGEVKILAKDFEPRVRLRRQQLIDDYSQYLQYQQYFGMDMSSQLQSIETKLNSPELVGQEVLDAMIDEQLIRLEAEKRGITVSEEELNERVEAGFGFYPNGTPTPSATPTAFDLPTEPDLSEFITPTPDVTATPLTPPTLESSPTASLQPTVEGATAKPTATLEPTATATITLTPTITPTTGPTSTPLPTATPFTREGFEGVLQETNDNLSKYGLDEIYIRSFFENVILREKLEEIFTAEVPNYETQIRARHILVVDSVTAENIIERLKGGADFAELAREFSTDTGSGAQGGDLGWFGKNQMVPEFEAAAYALEKPGDFTLEPVQSQFGFHIIQLMGKMDRPLSDSDFQLAKDVEFRKWLDAAREEYGVETFDFWKQRIPSEPNFITAATEGAEAQMTAQAESLNTLEAANETPTP